MKLKTDSVTGTTGGNALLPTNLNTNDIVIVHARTANYDVSVVEYPSGKYAFTLWGVDLTGAFTPAQNVTATVSYDYIERSSTT